MVTNVQIKDTFNEAADKVIGKYLLALVCEHERKTGTPLTWDDVACELPRSDVVPYLATHGGPDGELVAQWVRSTPGWSEVCDTIGVPKAWVP